MKNCNAYSMRDKERERDKDMNEKKLERAVDSICATCGCTIKHGVEAYCYCPIHKTKHCSFCYFENTLSCCESGVVCDRVLRGSSDDRS